MALLVGTIQSISIVASINCSNTALNGKSSWSVVKDASMAISNNKPYTPLSHALLTHIMKINKGSHGRRTSFP